MQSPNTDGPKPARELPKDELCKNSYMIHGTPRAALPSPLQTDPQTNPAV